jgi:hypothetical protein
MTPSITFGGVAVVVGGCGWVVVGCVGGWVGG